MIAIERPSMRRRSSFLFGRLAVFVVGAFFLAGAIHIVIILLVPFFAQSDGWSRLSAVAADNGFAVIPVTAASTDGVQGLDPLFVNGACRIDLAQGPAEITLEARDRFWSLALYDPLNTILFSLNDRTAVDGRLDMLVLTPAQRLELMQNPPPGIEQRIVVDSASEDLIVLLRLFAPTAGSEEEAREIVAAAECAPASLPAPVDSSGGADFGEPAPAASP